VGKRLKQYLQKLTPVQIVKIASLCIIAASAAFGIYQWTKNIEERQLEQELQETQQQLEEELKRNFDLQTGSSRVLRFPFEEGFNPEYLDDPPAGSEQETSAIDAYMQELAQYTSGEQENILVYERFNQSVVNITTQTYRLNFFLEPVPESGSGSGSIIDTQGHIVTNYHVVQDADQVYVKLFDGTVFEGAVIGRDRESDIAIVKIDPKGKELYPIQFGTSESIRVGQKVLAIGNPFGYDRTLTTGIISGLGRPIRTDDNLIMTDMIQTDASINPGNSGGPLLDGHGRLIGINTSIYSPSGGSVGIGFAVPVDKAKRVIAELIAKGRVVRGWLDITPVQLDSMIVEYANLPVEQGILVSEVRKGGPAEAAGLRGGDNAVKYGSSVIYLGGDIIIKVDGQEVADYADMFSALEDNKPGDVVEVVIVRNGKLRTLNIELIERPEEYAWN